MRIDGHLAQWGVPAGQEAQAVEATLGLLISLMRQGGAETGVAAAD